MSASKLLAPAIVSVCKTIISISKVISQQTVGSSNCFSLRPSFQLAKCVSRLLCQPANCWLQQLFQSVRPLFQLAKCVSRLLCQSANCWLRQLFQSVRPLFQLAKCFSRLLCQSANCWLRQLFQS